MLFQIKHIIKVNKKLMPLYHCNKYKHIIRVMSMADKIIIKIKKKQSNSPFNLENGVKQ